MQVNDSIPQNTDKAFQVLGFFFNFRKYSTIGYFLNKRNKLKGIGGEFENDPKHKYFFTAEFHEDYIAGLKLLLNKLHDKNRNKYFSDAHINKIIEWEKSSDKLRGDYNVYIRMLIVTWLVTAGVYVNDFFYIGNLKLGNGLPSRHSFLVRTFIKKEGNELVFVGTKTLKNNFFDLGFKSNLVDKISFTSRNVNDVFSSLYKGHNNMYIILFSKTIEKFYSLLSEKDRAIVTANVDFIKKSLQQK